MFSLGSAINLMINLDKPDEMLFDNINVFYIILLYFPFGDNRDYDITADLRLSKGKPEAR